MYGNSWVWKLIILVRHLGVWQQLGLETDYFSKTPGCMTTAGWETDYFSKTPGCMATAGSGN